MVAAETARDQARQECEDAWYLMEIAKVLHDDACPENQNPTSECWRAMFEWFHAMDAHKEACARAAEAEQDYRNKATDVVDCISNHKHPRPNIWFR